MDWQPLNTAPRDGRPLLLMTDQGIRLGRWSTPEGYDFAKPPPSWRSIPCEWQLLGVTRWQPAPVLPDIITMRRECAIINGRTCTYPGCDCTPIEHAA